MNQPFLDLTALADRHVTDKGSKDGDRHLYTELYAALFESFRLQKFNLLEMGLLRSPNRVEEKDPGSRKVGRIPSVEMWLEYFPQADIYGFDLADFSTFEKPRFTFLRGDLSQDADIERLAKSVPQQRIIIDDASHASFHQQRAFLKLFPILESGGFYVIEDLHYSPPFEPSLPPCRKMFELVQEFRDTGTLSLDFGAPEEVAAVAAQISQTFIHCSARGRHGWGPKLVIFQKAHQAGAVAAAPAKTHPLLNAAWLTSRSFSFHCSPPYRCIHNALRFDPNGRITGYRHQNEDAWRIEDGRLFILRANGEPSCILEPRKNDDGSISLHGPFLATPQVEHRFEENRTQALPEVCTFDLFDTLVARRCYDPISIFRNVEARSGVKDFTKFRQMVEKQLWDEDNYNFDDIYRMLGKATNWPASLLERLRMMELAEEWNHLFPIAEMVARVWPDDMIVSDMYLPLDFVRRIVEEKCGLVGRKIHLSSHGKGRGKIWPVLQASHVIRRHHGDNAAHDVEKPRGFGISTEHTTISHWTRGEKILRDAGLDAIAKQVREARLSHVEPDPSLREAARAQFEFNLPLLILGSAGVLQHAALKKIDTLLMCARDCNLWLHLMRVLAARGPVPLSVRYLVSSRVLMLSGSAEYRAYVESLSGNNNLIVDVSGSGRSPSHFINFNQKQNNMSAYLLVVSDNTPLWVDDLAPERDNSTVTSLLSLPKTNNVHWIVEPLNMSLDERAIRMTFDGQRFVPVVEPNEFGPRSRRLIGAMRNAFFAGIKVMEREQAALPGNIPAETLHKAVEELVAMASDFNVVTQTIQKDISNNEQAIANFAKSEQIQNKSVTPLT